MAGLLVSDSAEWGTNPRVRPLALCLVRRPSDGALLVAPGFDHVKQQRFYRPLGGEIEFGELAVDAARRELMEEIGAEVENLSLLGVFENIFTFLGRAGHELVWCYEGAFTDPSFYDRDVIPCNESGSPFEAHWVPRTLFLEGKAPLYPDGLLGLLTQAP
jgi:ADP-ribose pyrophosphatase YjhB (NUDIX family)